MLRKRIQLGLIHVAVAMTLVPINSTLNRVMIKEMAISATLVAILASLPYLFSPTQIAIGSYSDRHPLLGRRRSPYIAAGLLLCAAGVMLAPHVVFILPSNWWGGLLLSFLTFAAWGMGYNLASVSYISLASELSGEKGRSRTVAVMWFMMIVGIIFTAASLGQLLEPYSDQALKTGFEMVGLAALALGFLGLVRLEPRHSGAPVRLQEGERTSWVVLIRAVFSIPQARSFFIYMIVLLGAILGQDVLLEPYGGEAFGLSVQATTRITSIWGVCVLASLTAAGALERRVEKHTIAQISAWVALGGFLIIATSGLLGSRPMFYAGIVLLGLGTGSATVSNLSLMLDMTTSQVGLFIGAWGISNALARLVGNLMSGALRDLVARLSQDAVAAYVTVFFLQAAMIFASWWMLRAIDVQRFRQQTQALSLSERAALMNDAP